MSVHLSSSLALFFALFAQVSTAQTTLTVAAAADLSSLLPQLQQPFEKTGGIRLRFVIGPSAALAQQIENGAPYDVFLSANAEYVDRLAANRKIEANSIRTYATGRVALLWRDKKPHHFNDLAENWVRFVALPNPKLAPYGVAAQQALERAGIWKEVQPKVVYGENVRQTLELFDSGNADAVLTADSLVQGREASVIPQSWHQPIIQKAGIVSARPNQAAAEKFLRFLLSPAGQAVFARFGFGSSGRSM